MQVIRQVIGFCFVNIHHQAFAAVAAGGTIDLRGDLMVQRGHQTIYFLFIMCRQERPERIIFGLFFRGKSFDIEEIGMELGVFQEAKLTGIYCFST
jgi:hypothetical protein